MRFVRLFILCALGFAAAATMSAQITVYLKTADVPSSLVYPTESSLTYFGFTETTGLTAVNFLSRVVPPAPGARSVVGIDSGNVSAPRTVTENLTLPANTYLGTSTKVTLSGTLAPADSTMRLAAVNGGHLIVASPFATSATSLLIGIPNQPGTVQLNAGNSGLASTTLQSGTLLLGHGNALGHGSLNLAADNLTFAASTNLTFFNFISANSPGTTLNLGLASSTANLTLNSGFSAAVSKLNYVGAGTLTLGGFGNYTELSINAAGNGGVVMNSGSPFAHLTLNSGSLTFSSPYAALFGGLDGSENTRIILNKGANLALYTDLRSHVSEHRGTIAGDGSLTLGFGGIKLTGNNTYSGGTTLDGFAEVQVGHSNALGSGPVTVHNTSNELSAVAAGITLANNFALQADFDFGAGLSLAGDYLFTLAGIISGPGELQKYADNTVRLSGNNTFAGGIRLYEGTLEFASDTAAGTGPLTLYPRYVSVTDTFAPIAAASMPATAVFTSSAPLLRGLGDTSGGFADVFPVVQLAANSTLTVQQNDFSEFYGTIAGTNARLNKAGYGLLLLGGTGSYTGGTTVTRGGLVFGRDSAIPASGLVSVSADGYAGFADRDGSVANFLGKFDRGATHGSVGFDTPPSDVNTFTVTAPIDLKGFAADARLGSATHAILDAAATISPQSTSYRFGGGGGLLEVASPLNGVSSLVVESPNVAPLTLRLTNSGNTFTNVSATQSAVVFAPGALPASATLAFGAGGYIGTEDTALNSSDSAMAAYVARFPTTGAGVIGFDAAPGASSPRQIDAAINLATRGNFALGTTALGSYRENSFIPGVTLAGPIVPSGNTYRFTGYKGGALQVASPLVNGDTAARNLVIGDPSSIAMLGDPRQEELSTVVLTGANTFSGGTTLHGGRLLLGTATSLGTGALTVSGTALPADVDDVILPELGAAAGGLTFANNIALASGLTLGGRHTFTLSGVISGSGGLSIEQDLSNGSPAVTLSGNNTFSGGIYLESGTLNLDHDRATGTGRLSIGRSEDYYDATINFLTAAPVIGGLESDRSDVLVSLAEGTRLTINQTTGTTFNGTIASADQAVPDVFTLTAAASGAQIVKTGPGTLRLESDGTRLTGLDTGGTRISADLQQGTVIVGSLASAPFGYDTVKLSGGTLALDNASLPNSLLAISGRIAGNGSFTNGNPSIGAGTVLSPGFAVTSGQSAIGQLSFVELTLASGGTFEWNLQNNGGAFSSDFVLVDAPDTLTISSSATSPFTLKLISLTSTGTPGLLSGLQPGESYHWLLFGANHIDGFSPDKFAFDTSQFQTGSILGNLSITQQSLTEGSFATGLMLNFTAVPEPSTWALLLTGLAAVAFATRRRRA